MSPAARGAALVALLAAALSGCAGPDRAAPDAGSISADAQALFATIDSLALVGAPAPAVELLRAHVERIEREGASTVEEVETLLWLGRAELELGNLKSGMPHLGRAVELAERAGPEHRLLEARARNAWGVGAKNQGRYDDARHSHESAAGIARALGDEGRRELASALAGIGAVLRRDPALRDSTALFQGQAIQLLRAAEGDTSLTLARMRIGYALVLAQLDRIDEASAQVDVARPLLEARTGPENSSRTLASSLAGWLGFRRGDLPAARRALEQALDAYAHARLEADAGSDRLRYRPKAADVLAAVHLAAGRPEEAWNVLDAAQSMLFHESIAVGAPGQALSTTVPPHARATVQATLDAETALIGWLDVMLVEEAPVEAWAYVLRDRGPVRWIRLDVAAPPDPGTVHRLREQLRLALHWPGRIAPTPETTAAAQAVWRERFARIEPALESVRKLVIVMSPGIAEVPIDVLVDERGTALVDRFVTSYIHAPSTRVDLARRAASAPRAQEASALFIDGDLLSRGGRVDGRVGPTTQFAHATRLAPGRQAEAAVRATWPARAAAAPPQFVQFDGHALVDHRLPGSSALVLDGKGRGMRALGATGESAREFVDAPDDGLLSVVEIEHMRLPADLVVLAACRSAGGFVYGGFMGIGDAFLRAGANSVMSSLWLVDERATIELLRRFSAHAYGPDGAPRLPPPEALRLARQEVRSYVAPDGTQPFAHPTYWAPFVLVGEAAGGAR